MNKRVLIVGAGGFGREILHWLDTAVQSGDVPDWKIGGFLDANPRALADFDIDLPIVGDPANYEPQADDVFLCAIGAPKTKLKVCRSLLERGADFPAWVHPTALVGARSRIGRGSLLLPNSGISVDVTLGEFVTLNCRAVVGHDAVVGDGCTLNSFVDVAGAAVLGTGVLVGSHGVVAPRAKVGDFTTIGAGSVVVRRTKPETTVLGVPAKRLEFPAETSAST
ncbi:MAG: NeuD/PglB/VioB family sugar acetyltransferase [Planctomycetota bacterium]|jgi:sugar O-acyltransferase (sialic acid O-acetyltransferase NeuD family)